jgi:8-oxo-dGTP pyrophosphatase MutT (NUDIX family)
MKKTRVAAIIETPEGILVVQDPHDKYRAHTIKTLANKIAMASLEIEKKDLVNRLNYAIEIVQDGRYSLPGGGIDEKDYINADATELYGLEVPLSSIEQIEAYRRVVKEAVARELEEELGLGVDMDSMLPILEIQGRERNHIICIVHAQGRLELNKAELSGIGFLNDPSVIPLNKYFFQSHVIKLFGKYIKTDQHAFYASHFLSRLNIPQDLVDDWYMDAMNGYNSRGSKSKRKVRKPAHPSSSPNLLIYDHSGQPVYNLRADSFTNAKKARIVPAPSRPITSKPPKGE